MATMALDLERAGARRLGDIPTVALAADFVSAAAERSALAQLAASPRWQAVAGRRVQAFGGVVSARGALIPAPLASWLAPLAERVAAALGGALGGAVNHVLANAYAEGEGILPHEDGPVYAPVVAILSLGSPAVMRFRRKADGAAAPPALSVVLPPCSLLVFADDAYQDCLHGIDAAAEEALDASVTNAGSGGGAAGGALRRSGERVSLTFRRVLAVHKLRVA
jgi:alkylated DNA repair protein alkB family protein 6